MTAKLGRTRQAKARKVRVRCDQCAMLSINDVACHETGCPNSGATWSEYRQEWVHYYECRNCGFDVERGEYCNCMEPIAWIGDNDNVHGNKLQNEEGV